MWGYKMRLDLPLSLMPGRGRATGKEAAVMYSISPEPKTSWRDAWNRFFFAESRADSLALMRVLLCAAVLIPIASRWTKVREIYSTDGVVTPLWEMYQTQIELPVLSGNAAVVAYTALVFCLFTALIGWQTRTSLAISAVLVIYFGLLDYAGTLTKYTVISMHGLLMLACSPSGAAWSVDAALKGDMSGSSVRIGVWPYRVIQLFLAILYFATAVTKARTPEYMTGEHTLFWMQTNMNFPHPVGYWLSTHPALLVISSYIVVIWEALFPAICWNRYTLRPTLALGVVFHLMTYLLLGLAIFPLIMLAFYPAFLNPAKARALWLRLRDMTIGMRDVPAIRFASYAWAFPLVLGLTLVTAVEAEYHFDPMGLRAPKPELPVIPKAVALERLQDTDPSRPAEFVHRVELGLTSFAGVVQSGRSTFKPFDSPILQVWAAEPHPDLYLHVDVVNEAEISVLHDGLVLPRGELRASIPFALAGNLMPGSYAFVLRDDVGVVARRPFRVVAD